MKESKTLYFIDTNILVYAFDFLEGEKHTKAKKLVENFWESNNGCISIQVLQEFHAAITRPRAKTFGLQESQEIIKSFSYWNVYSPKPVDVMQAITIQQKNKISFWDAMIIQCALASGCKILYSEDLTHGRIFQGVKVVNPFMELTQIPN